MRGRAKYGIAAFEIACRKDINHGAFRLYAILAAYADHHKRICFPRISLLADDMGVSPRQIQTWMKELVEAGVVTRLSRERPDGTNRSNRFTLNDGLADDCEVELRPGEEESEAELHPQCEAELHPFNTPTLTVRSPVSTPSPDSQPPETDTSRESVSRTSVREEPVSDLFNGAVNESHPSPAKAPRALHPPKGFAQFWAKYPRKVGKASALKAYRAAVDHASIDDIQAGLERSIRRWSEDGTDVHYIPHPTTWLNGGRWDDEDAPPEFVRQRNGAPVDYRDLYPETPW